MGPGLVKFGDYKVDFWVMQIQHLFQPFDIDFLASDECPMKMHKHSYFELVFILSGCGTHYVGDSAFEYYPDNLFLLAPMEFHHFKVKEYTSFLFIRFNNIYLEGQMVKEEHGSLGQWVQKLEYIFQNSRSQGCIIQNQQDKPLARAIIDAIRREYADADPAEGIGPATAQHPDHRRGEEYKQIICRHDADGRQYGAPYYQLYSPTHIRSVQAKGGTSCRAFFYFPELYWRIF